MERFAYVGVLLLIVAASVWLEFVVRTRVFVRLRRLALTVVPVVAVFYLWDVYAVARGHWSFDPDRILGVHLPGGVPLDEVLFFATIPVVSVLTLEAVRSVRGWSVGDEPAVGDQPTEGLR